ncbi:MAG: hypothetical protein WA101_02885 [Minisyncoccia bacterium]
MTKIMIIHLDNDSQKIADSLQKFYGDKARVDIMKITDKPLNINIFFFNGMRISYNMYNEKKLLKELANTNWCKRIAFYGIDEDGNSINRQEDDYLYHEKLRSMYGKEGEGFYYDYKIWKGHLLSSTWYSKNDLLDFLTPKEKPNYPFTRMQPEDFAEY